MLRAGGRAASHRAFERRSVGKLRRVVAVEEIGSEDCQGHALWALGLCVSQVGQGSFQMLAAQTLSSRRCPNETEREGYVPNIVYTCGALLHGHKLVIPYAMSDYATSFATVSLDELLAAME